MSEYVLELKGITKIFPGVKALNNVQFQLKPGEVHALMGENGAGKSTFIKVITGVHKAEEGEMYLFGEKVDFKGPKDAQEAGIAAVYQHPTSYPHLTVAENIFMGHEIKKNHMIQWKAMNEEANKLLTEQTLQIIELGKVCTENIYCNKQEYQNAFPAEDHLFHRAFRHVVNTSSRFSSHDLHLPSL